MDNEVSTRLGCVALSERSGVTRKLFCQVLYFDFRSESCASTVCGACEKARAKTMLQLFGQPYNSNTLASLPPDQDSMMNRVSTALRSSWGQ